MPDSDWLIANILKTPCLDWINFISARLNRKSILIFYHDFFQNQLVKNIAFFVHFYSFLRLFNFYFLTIWDILNLPFFFYLLRCCHWIETEKMHVLNLAENTLAYTHQDIESTVSF